MLVITRKPGSSILIGDGIKVTFLGMQGHSIRVGIEAPRELPIHRDDAKCVQPSPEPETVPEPHDTWAGFVPRSERIARKRRRAQANRRARMAAALAIDPYCRCGVQLRIVTDPVEIKRCPPDMAQITPDGEACCPECRQLRA